MAYAFFGVGVLLLFFGSEGLLSGGIGLSRNAGLSPLLIGLLVVTASTSAPELAVVLQTARSAPDVAIGDIIGSNLFNILLILGFGALIRPLASPPKVVFRDGGALLASGIALAMIVLTGRVSREFGMFLLAGFALYLVVSFITDWRRAAHLSAHEAKAACRIGSQSPSVNATYLICGAIGVFLGARCLIDGGLALAAMYRLPPFMAALTLITLGTSLPELVVTSVAIARRRADYAAGHIIASSIFNVLFVLGLAAFLHPLHIPALLARTDVLIMTIAAALLLPLLMLSWRLTRLRGALLMLGYIGYVGFLAWRQGLVTPGMIGLH